MKKNKEFSRLFSHGPMKPIAFQTFWYNYIATVEALVFIAGHITPWFTEKKCTWFVVTTFNFIETEQV